MAERRLCANVRQVAWREPRTNRRRWKGYQPKVELSYVYYPHNELPPVVKPDARGNTTVRNDHEYHHHDASVVGDKLAAVAGFADAFIASCWRFSLSRPRS